jgi:hypothetical protein
MRKSQFSRPLTTAFNEADFEEIKRTTDDMQISMAQFVREAVAAALKTNQQKGDLCNEQ